MCATKKCLSTRGTGGEAIRAIYDRSEELCSGGEVVFLKRSIVKVVPRADK